ncbi:MAG: site-specific integrase [Clostridia bacterium]|jgi:integrase|nr:site-specific integrase [Clostridia bacterium]
MATITLEEEVLQKLLKQITTVENKKRKEGSYELYRNGRARLYYMLDNVSHRTTVDAKNEEEAQKALDSFIEKVKKGEFIDTNYTFAEFAQIWLDKKIKPNAGDRCIDKYIGALNTRILPYIGNIKLKKLTKQKLENYFNMIKNTKTQYANRKENSTVKPDTVKKWKSIIHACLEYAVDCEILSKNPCDKITIVFTNTTDEKTIKQLVKSKREKIKYYNYNEYKFVCNLAEEEFQYFYYNNKISNIKKLREVGRRFLVLLDLKTGMRRSELFGLTREDLSIKDLTFDVNKSRHYLKGKGKYTKYPKNDSSIRIKSFPKSLLKYLKLYYELLDNLNYTEEYIFEYLSIDGSGSWFDEWQDRNNIKNIKFHDLRHTHATILLYLGVDIKTISERLGHADIQTTLNIYADVLKELDIKSVEKIDTL